MIRLVIVDGFLSKFKMRSFHKFKIEVDSTFKAAIFMPDFSHRNRLNLELHDRVNRGDCVLVAKLLESGADVNHRDIVGDTPLMEAAWIGDRELVELLLDRGADLNLMNRHAQTALDVAIESAREMKHSAGHQEVVRILKSAIAPPKTI